MAGGTDPTEWIKGLAESASRIRLAPGVIGKSSLIQLGVVVLWGIVLFRLSEVIWIDCALIATGLFATYIAARETKKMREYAVENPSLALMEGADITEYQRFQSEAKGRTLPADAALTTDNPKLIEATSSLKGDGNA